MFPEDAAGGLDTGRQSEGEGRLEKVVGTGESAADDDGLRIAQLLEPGDEIRDLAGGPADHRPGLSVTRARRHGQ
jgi:hypothetical protein